MQVLVSVGWGLAAMRLFLIMWIRHTRHNFLRMHAACGNENQLREKFRAMTRRRSVAHGGSRKTLLAEFEGADLNHDGVLDAAEYKAMMAGRASMASSCGMAVSWLRSIERMRRLRSMKSGASSSVAALD